MTSTISAVHTNDPGDSALKQRHRAMWALGDYPSVVQEVVGPLGPVLVDASGVDEGQDVLDVAAGSGNAAIPAALRGGRVTASDLTPELLDAGRRHAAPEGVDITWDIADAENLPYDSDSFDTVLSCLGVMFAPHHQAGADELIRVTRPGGRIGLLNWTPEGFIGQMFATMKPYAPVPPPGAQPPPLWGNPDHVLSLFGDRVTDVRFERRTLTVTRFPGDADFREFFKAAYGPTIVTYRNIADDQQRVAELDRALDDLARRFRTAGGNRAMEWEYLVVTAVKKSVPIG
ncbi:class I SAM-dependent methyltransferase [Nakamurella sp. GG22]